MYKYFEPKKFEQWNGRSIYEFLGVKFFKKYLLPDQLLLTRKLGKKKLLGGRGKLIGELRRLEWETKRNEVIHFLALSFIVFILFVESPALSMLQILYIFIINLYVNIYPIFVQRYNRFRLKRLLHKQG
jgi:glycosyl-4,4'-diaponeurosporenoate acyltransferase